MRLLICAGGTGGGVYPALAVLQAAENDPVIVEKGERKPAHGPKSQAELDGLSVLWVGGEGGMEEDLISRRSIPFKGITAAGVHGVGIKTLPGNAIKLWRGYWQSREILKQFQPDVLFFTGGYLAVPMAFAGRRIPKLMFVPDIEPGLALKTIAPIADRVALSTEDSVEYFPRHKGISVTGYPVRSELKTWEKEAARQALNLRPGMPTLLVMGGSKGARSINRALLVNLRELLSDTQVVHISGELDWQEVEETQARLEQETPELSVRYQAFPYLHHELGAAYTAADLVLSRAGASVLGEYPHFGLPAILIPYPHAWRYQRVNAEFLARRGAALVLDEAELQAKLLPLIRELIHDVQKREQMQRSMRSLARPKAAMAIFELLQALASKRDQERN